MPDISGASGPVYLSICAALARDIERGQLGAGDRLPPQRELAERLGIDVGTVTRAYAEARRTGLIDAEGRRGSFVRAANRSTISAEVAPFDTGMNLPPIPARSTLAQHYARTLQTILSGPAAANRLQYQPSGGAPVDRAAGAAWLAARGIEASEDNTLVVSGAQTALHAIAGATLQDGDAVCCGPFVYPGWLAIARRRNLRIVPVGCDDEGIDPDALAAACAGGSIRAVYIVPTNDNPTTATLSAARRARIAAVARRDGLAIIEDDPYGCLSDPDLPPIAHLAPELTWHVSSLSKAISPALRIAYLRAPSVRDTLMLAADVHETTIMPPPLNMAVCTEWLTDGTWRTLVEEVRAECAARQKIVARLLPEDSYRTARHGYHLWVPLGPDTSPFEIVSALRPTGMSAVSSEAFASAPDAEARAIRLSIGGNLDREALTRSLTVLDAVMHHRAGRRSPIV